MECPACGGPVTMEVGPDKPLSASVADALLAADEDEQIIVARNRWACGWSEERSVVIDLIETTEGDATAVERAVLLDDIMSEAMAIDDLGTLEDTLAEIRRQRRLETAASGSLPTSTVNRCYSWLIPTLTTTFENGRGIQPTRRSTT